MKLRYKVTIFILIAVISSTIILTSVKKTEASVAGSVASFTGCTVGGLIAPWLTKQLNDALDIAMDSLSSWLTGTLKSKSLAGVIGLGSKVPVIDNSFMGAFMNKAYRTDVIARCAAREILTAMTTGMLNKARTSGRDGGVTFIRNWRNFQTKAEYRGENIFRAMLSSSNMCPYLANDVKGIFGVNKKTALPGVNTRTDSLDPFSVQVGCTMPQGFDVNKYNQDFSGNGGWEAYSRLLEPQNNFYGVLFQSSDEANKQRALEKSTDVNQILANKGFLGISGSGATDSCALRASNGDCIKYKDIKTPGSYINDALAATVQQELGWVANVHEINGVVSDLTQVLINRLMDLGNSNEGSGVLVTPIPEPTPTPTPESSLSCAEQGLSQRYGGDVQTAIGEFLAANPSIANSPDDGEGGPNNTAFMDGVVNTLTAKGFTAGRVLHEATGQLSGDKIIVGHNPPDLDGEVYDIVIGGGDGRTFGSAGKTTGGQCVAHDPWSSLIPAGGGGGGTPTPTPGP